MNTFFKKYVCPKYYKNVKFKGYPVFYLLNPTSKRLSKGADTWLGSREQLVLVLFPTLKLPSDQRFYYTWTFSVRSLGKWERNKWLFLYSAFFVCVFLPNMASSSVWKLRRELQDYELSINPSPSLNAAYWDIN